MQKDDFCAAALSLEASRDVGAQLFCALLRSAGVETRLVCSLQPLPFNVTAIPGTSLKKESTVPTSRAEVHTPMNDDEIYDDARETQSSSMSKPTGSTGPRRILSGVQMRTSQTLQSGGISVNRGTSPTSTVPKCSFPYIGSDVPRNPQETRQRITVSRILDRGLQRGRSKMGPR